MLAAATAPMVARAATAGGRPRDRASGHDSVPAPAQVASGRGGDCDGRPHDRASDRDRAGAHPHGGTRW